MTATIRLMRVGKKGYAAYRIVVMDKKQKRNSKYIAKIGFYDPNTKPAIFNLDEKKFEQWSLKGAVISEGLKKLTTKKIACLKS